LIVDAIPNVIFATFPDARQPYSKRIESLPGTFSRFFKDFPTAIGVLHMDCGHGPR
jgi:hypothetical protein